MIKEIGEEVLGFLHGLIALVIGVTITLFVGSVVLGFITLCLGAL